MEEHNQAGREGQSLRLIELVTQHMTPDDGGAGFGSISTLRELAAAARPHARLAQLATPSVMAARAASARLESRGRELANREQGSGHTTHVDPDLAATGLARRMRAFAPASTRKTE